MDSAVLATENSTEERRELHLQQQVDEEDDVWLDSGGDGMIMSIDDEISTLCSQGSKSSSRSSQQHQQQQQQQSGGGSHGRTCLLLTSGLAIGAAIGSVLPVDGVGGKVRQRLFGASSADSSRPPAVRRPKSFEPIVDGPAAETIYDPMGVAATDGEGGDDEGGDASTSSSSSGSVEPVVPPMSELVGENDEIRGEISWMMDFAIIGNPKCGTTFLMHWLDRNDDTFVHNGEFCALSKDRPGDIVSTYYDQVVEEDGEERRMATTDEGHRIKGGLKCPKEINTEMGLENWQKYFPETKFIVTLRHPVLWFQSFYNYEAYGGYPKHPLPHPNELIGACFEGSEYLCIENCGHPRPGRSKICTDRANFHHSLSRLGKTDMSTSDEAALLDHNMSIVPHKGKLFLMEISQLFPDNPASFHLREDMQDFLDLKYELRHLNERKTGTNRREYKDKEKRQAFINICDDEYRPVREVLTKNGAEAARWIRDYLMKSDDVVVSQPKLFVELIEMWGEDPCDAAPGRRLVDYELE